MVLQYLENFDDEDMLLQVLTRKLVMLLALFIKQRVQILHAISIDDIDFYNSCVIIPIRKLLKQSRRGNYKLSLHLSIGFIINHCVLFNFWNFIYIARV